MTTQNNDRPEKEKILSMSTVKEGMDSLITSIDNWVGGVDFFDKKSISITSSQLRNIYDKLLKIEDTDFSGIQLLRPKLAYIAARQKNKKAKEIVKFFNEIIEDIDSEDEVKSFKIFFEAVVAYHKFHSLKQEEA